MFLFLIFHVALAFCVWVPVSAYMFFTLSLPFCLCSVSSIIGFMLLSLLMSPTLPICLFVPLCFSGSLIPFYLSVPSFLSFFLSLHSYHSFCLFILIILSVPSFISFSLSGCLSHCSPQSLFLCPPLTLYSNF